MSSIWIGEDEETINFRGENISQGRDRVFGVLIDDVDEAIAPSV
jgi:hypothetical protein